jgi:UDP-N-acetyl-D-glucosamine dehydrogenase
MKNKVSVVGQGYVGLPLALAAAKMDYSVVGIDTDKKRVDNLQRGISNIEDIDTKELKNYLQNQSYVSTNEFSSIKDSKIVLICVPTPLNEDGNPDLTFIVNATTEVGKYIKKSTLVIIESTVATGTTREVLVPILIKESGLSSKDILVAFSPERIDPLNQEWNISNTPKIVAGLTNEACELAFGFYSKFIEKVVRCDSLEVAETAKLLENAFRFINISFINEMSAYCSKFGIEINDVIQAAATKPYGFLPFYPSIGIGGHCIPVDPVYLSKKAQDIGSPLQFIELAQRVNLDLPDLFVKKAEKLLGDLNGKRILIVGVSYKSNIADTRESPVKPLLGKLRERNAKVFWHDDLVKEWNDEKSVPITSDYDLAIIATPHAYLDLSKLGNVPVVNTRRST